MERYYDFILGSQIPGHYSPIGESVPRLSKTLIEKGLNLFEHQGFLGERRGGQRRILLANKSYLPFQVNRGQRLGVEAVNQEEQVDGDNRDV